VSEGCNPRPLTSGGAMKLTKNQRQPLRKIVDTKPGPYAGALVEVLECGHEQRQKSDIYGPTNAYARRCRQCVTPHPVREIKAKEGR
jgi:hypothetical protein